MKNEEKVQVINPGVAEGVILGGHLSSFNYLLTNGFEVSDKEIILIVEEDGTEEREYLNLFKEKINLLIKNVGKERIKAILIGRSQFPISKQKWSECIKELNLTMPIACNLDLGHTSPTLSIPIGEKIKLEFKEEGNV